MGETHRSISLDSATSDFTRFVKAKVQQFLAAEAGYKEIPLLDFATERRSASSRLKAMCEISPESFREYEKQITAPVFPEQRGRMLNKASVGIGSIDGGTWGSVLAPYAQGVEAFAQSLGPFDAFDRMLTDRAFYPIGLRTRGAVASSAAIGSSVAELAAKPMSAMSFTQAQNAAVKVVGEVVVSDELLRMTVPAADQLFQLEMQKAVALATDTKFLQIVATGAGSTHASTGLSAAGFLSDLALALGSVQIDPGARLYYVLPVAAYKTASLLRDTGGLLITNGKIGNINVIPSSGTLHDGYLINAASVGADSDLVTIQISREASVEMADNPTATDWHTISLFQNNLVLIRAERFFGATVLRTSGISAVTAMV
jgi:hypothetical protein